MRSERRPLQQMPNSLMSGASAHTVKPSDAPEAAPLMQPRRKVSLGVLLLGGASAVLGLAGAASLSHFRTRPEPVMNIVSGNPTMKKAEDGASVRWHSAKTKIYFDASLDGVGERAREAVQLAFGTWVGSSAKLPNIEFDTTNNAQFGQKPNGKSEVMYGPITLAGHENDLALTVTFSDPKTGEVIESDMIFNKNHPFGLLPLASVTPATTMVDDTACQRRYDLQSVATHEAGHFFGLGEDFEARPATMFYTTGRCETNKRALLSSDEDTMSTLYVASDAQGDDASGDSAKGCGGARIGLGTTNGNGSVPLISLSGLLGFVAWRRQRRS